MNIQHPLAITALLCAGLWPFLGAEAGAPSAEVSPQRQSLVIPVTMARSRAKPAASLECVVTFGPATPISAVTFSPDGKSLAVGGYQQVLIWDLASAVLSRRVGVGHLSNSVHDLAFTADGRSLAVAEGTPCGSGAVKVLDMETGQPNLSFEGPEDVVYSLALSPNGKLLAAGGADALVHIWSMNDKKVVATIKEHGDWVWDVSFSPDGKFLATGSADNTLRIWDVGSWKAEGKIQQAGTVHSSAFSPDGGLLAVAVGGPSQRAVYIRRLADAKQTRPTRPTRTMYTRAGTPLDVIWARKANRIYVACSDNTVKGFDARNGRPVATFSGHRDWVYCIALSPDETKLASGSGDGTVKLWSASDGRLLATLVQLSPRTDDWLIITAQGYLAASDPASLKWNTTGVKTPAEKITGILNSSELVQKTIAGEKTSPPALE